MDIIFLVIALICGVGIGLLVNYLIAKSKGDAMLKKAKEDAENLKKALDALLGDDAAKIHIFLENTGSALGAALAAAVSAAR